MSEQEELSLDFVEDLLAQPDTTRRARASPKPDDRNINTWMQAQHIGTRNCEVPNHDESKRPRDKGMVTINKQDVAVCRICFLASLDKPVDSTQ